MTTAVANNVLEALRDEIRREMNEITDNMATGSCKTYPDYTHNTGVIKGLAMAERALLDLDKRIDEA